MPTHTMEYRWATILLYSLSVTLMRRTQRFELLCNIFASSNSSGARAVCVKILEKFYRGSR